MITLTRYTTTRDQQLVEYVEVELTVAEAKELIESNADISGLNWRFDYSEAIDDGPNTPEVFHMIVDDDTDVSYALEDGEWKQY